MAISKGIETIATQELAPETQALLDDPKEFEKFLKVWEREGGKDGLPPVDDGYRVELEKTHQAMVAEAQMPFVKSEKNLEIDASMNPYRQEEYHLKQEFVS